MKYFLTLMLIITSTISYSQPVDTQQNEVVFLNVNIIPMDKETVLENQTVVVKNGKIILILPDGKTKSSKNATVINGKGKYLMPGLSEMHGHVPPSDDLEKMKEVMLLFALNGVTTVRGMLGHPKHLQLKDMINRKEIIAPEFFAAGPPFNGQSVKNAAEAREKVRQQKKDGYDYLKILFGLTNETFEAMSVTAKEENMPFVGHVPYDVGIWKAIESGYSSIDHLDGFIEGLVPGIENITQEEAGLFGIYIIDKVDRTKIPQLMDALQANNVWVVPTQAIAERWMSAESAETYLRAPEMKYIDKETRNQWEKQKNELLQNENFSKEKALQFIKLRRELIKLCQDRGVGLLLGCDAPQVFNVPGFSTHHELQYLVDAGLTPYEALQTGTVNIGRYLNKGSNSGVIKEGAVANLMLLNGNPLNDIQQTKNIEGVLVGGKYLPKSYIEQELKKLVKN